MKITLRYPVALLAAYIVAWTLSYTGVLLSRGDGLDFSHLLEYLVLAWTLRASELPAFIWLISILAFVPLAALTVLILRKIYARRRRHGLR